MIKKVKNIYYLLLNVRDQIDSFITKQLRKKHNNQHQLTSTTKHDRYPKVFAALQQLVDRQGDVRILSYGCSTGEECFSLRKYFPRAMIIGADINLNNLKKALSKNQDSKIRFIESTSELLQANSPFSIILAMSVLCRWEDTKEVENCEKIYPFEKFENSIEELSKCLEPNGYLALYNSNFRLEDSSWANSFEEVEVDAIEDSGFVHKFDRNHKRLLEPHKIVIYRKIR